MQCTKCRRSRSAPGVTPTIIPSYGARDMPPPLLSLAGQTPLPIGLRLVTRLNSQEAAILSLQRRDLEQIANCNLRHQAPFGRRAACGDDIGINGRQAEALADLIDGVTIGGSAKAFSQIP